MCLADILQLSSVSVTIDEPLYRVPEHVMFDATVHNTLIEAIVAAPMVNDTNLMLKVRCKIV